MLLSNNLRIRKYFLKIPLRNNSQGNDSCFQNNIPRLNSHSKTKTNFRKIIKDRNKLFNNNCLKLSIDLRLVLMFWGHIE